MTYSTLHLPGTVKDWPAGLESTLTYRGLVLNDLSQPDRYKVKSISGLFDPDVRDSREVNPSRHGETAYTNYYGGKQIVISGTIYAGNLTKLRNMISDLQTAFSDISTEYPLYFNQFGNYAYINCKKSASIEITEEFNKRIPQHEFQITLRASDPFVYGDSINVQFSTNTTSVVGRVYARSYDSTYSNYSLVLDSGTITNNGNFNAKPIIDITGPANNIIVANYTTGKFIRINYNLAENFTIRYDTANNTMVIYQTNNSIIGSLDITSDDFYLAPGANIIGFGTSTIGTYNQTGISVTGKDTYI